MKKIICFLLSAMMLSGGIVRAEEGVEKKYKYAATVMQGLGLIDAPTEESEWQNNITRGEATEIIYKILHYDTYDSVAGEWTANFYGDKDANISQITDISSKDIYSDVDAEHEYYKYIKYLSERGIMNGFGDGTFRPDESIRPMHLAKVILDLMGYSPFVNSCDNPNETYQQLAVKLELVSGDAPSMTKAETAQFMYNALMTNYDSFSVTSVDFLEANDTILEEYLGLSYTKGVMTDNGYVSLTSNKSVGDGYVKINEHTLILNENCYDITEFLGRHTEAYYKSEGEDSAFEIAFAMLTEEDECFEIKGRDVKQYKSGTFTYYDELRTRNITFDDAVIVVYNNEVKQTYTSDLFLSNNCYISLITPKNGSKVETVIIKEYESIFVGAISENKVYNSIQYTSKSKVVDFDDSARAVIVYKPDGTRGSFKDIKTNTVVDVIQSNNLIEAKICNGKISEFTLTKITANDYGTVYSDTETTYNINEELKNSINLVDIKIGGVYTLYLNSLGDIAWLTNADSTEAINYALMLKAIEDTENFELPFLIYVLNNKNEWKWIRFSEKVTYSDEYGKEKRYNDEVVYNSYLKNYRGVVRYKTDEAGCVSYIEVPITDNSSTVDNKLRLLGKVGYEDENNDGKYDGMAWRDGSCNIGPDVIVDSTAKFLVQNPNIDPTNKDAYSFSGNILKDFGYYTLDAFVTKADSHRAELVLMQSTDVSDNLTVLNRGVSVIKNIREVVDEDGQAVTALDVYDMPEETAGSDKMLYLKDADVMNNITNMFRDCDANGDPITYQLKKGDIIRYAVDAYGKVNAIQLLWERNKPNEVASSGKTGGFTGTINWWDATKSGRTNPFGFVNDGLVSQQPLKITDLNFRALNGYAYKLYDNVLTVTTQELSVNTYDITESDSRFVSESYLIPNGKLVSKITMSRNGITAGAGVADDIKTYDKYGSDCSRIVLIGRNGSLSRMIIINEED